VYRTETAAGYGQRNPATDDSGRYLSIVVLPTARTDDRHWAFRTANRIEAVHHRLPANSSFGPILVE
jgi:hypothetical protein